ncbi:hypothetical protein UFOVP784_68 [uncultured Caudovirales phage]|uniref:Uncharacterized protein n=1 Tax=uncultured Caudovirales phage TaxID=2100421 RepID=A0A6J5MDN2_9CAUD|nr:hypothetical protein UFOVP436_68 [uncultured Caudovirales phage]CAB4162591.1 hypothetical protein UFOVP784_68 [uncultured Caudovirales phage]
MPSTAFAYIVDGEVAHLHFMANVIEHAVAAMKSDPKVVQIPEELVDLMEPTVGLGWTYVNGEFVPPSTTE